MVVSVPCQVPALAVRELGRIEYTAAWDLQKQLVQARREPDGRDVLLVCEHPPVITVGRGTQQNFLRDARFPIHEVERGGEATYHGPGQLVIYPIVAFADGAHDLHAWLRALEQACIETCAHFDLEAGRREGATGVWIDGVRKLVSLGVAARRWVSYHGLAFNQRTDLSHFEAINPCGFESSVMTSMERELGDKCPSRGALSVVLCARLEETLLRFREPIA